MPETQRQWMWRVAATALVTLFFASGCDSDTEPQVDIITAASPEVLALTEASHPGWNNATCGSCHEDGHQGVYTAPECVFCHGRNGAPERAPGRDDSDCSICHADVHPVMAFASPTDCQTCHHYAASDDCAVRSSHDVVIIGAGGGGLSAAAALAMEGLDVVMVERHHKVGGSLAVFERGDYRIEASLHGYTSVAQEGARYRVILESLDVWDRLRPVHSDPLYRVVLPDRDIVVPADAEEYRELLKAEWPEEADNIDALFERCYHLDTIYQCIVTETSTGEWCDDYIDRITGMLDIALAISEPLDQFVTSYISDPELITTFTILMSYAGTPPESLSAMFFLAMWGGYNTRGYTYFEGGSESIALAFQEVIEENGGRIELNTTATEIMVDETSGRATGIRTDDGRCFDGNYVVSNAPAPITLFDLLGREHLPADYVETVESMETSDSLFLVYLGVDHDYSDLFGEAHEIFLTPTDMADSSAAVAECDAANTQVVITNYSMPDPTAAPPGKNVITITGMLPYDCNGEWGWSDSREAYLTMREEVAQTFIERAEEHLPDLQSHIEMLEIATPQTIRAYTSNPGGAFIGWGNVSSQVFSNRLEQQTPVPGLLLVGAWTFPGGGVSQVIVSGRLAATAILEAEASE